MLVKRGTCYKARFQIGGRDTELALGQSNKRDAQRAHDIIEHELKSKRIARVLKDLLLEQCKALANKEIDCNLTRSPMAAIEAIAMHEAMEIVSKFLPAPPLTAALIWQNYLASPAAKELKPSSMTTKRQRVESFIAWAGERDCTQITARTAAQFLASLTCENATKRRYIAELSSVWKASPELNNPWTMALAEAEKVNPKEAFTLDEVRELVAAASGEMRAAIQIGFYTGLRFKDVCLLRWEHLQNERVDLSPNKTDRTGKHVSIPVLPPLRDVLAELPLSSVYVLPELASVYLQSRTSANKRFMALLAQCGLRRKGYGFHSLRHTFITVAEEAGINEKQIQAVVGHSDSATTARYYHGERCADLTGYPSL